jgi:predicted MFS family arabinose efflux permease
MMLDQGVSSNQASTAVAIMGVAMIAGRIACGLLMDRFHAPYVAAIFLSLPGISIFLFALGINSASVYVAALFLGLGVGAEFNSIAFLVSRFFGLANFGKIYGHIYAIFQFGHSIGPVAMGIAYDRTGEYTAMLWVALVMVVIATVLTAVLGEN